MYHKQLCSCVCVCPSEFQLSPTEGTHTGGMSNMTIKLEGSPRLVQKSQKGTLTTRDEGREDDVSGHRLSPSYPCSSAAWPFFLAPLTEEPFPEPLTEPLDLGASSRRSTGASSLEAGGGQFVLFFSLFLSVVTSLTKMGSALFFALILCVRGWG